MYRLKWKNWPLAATLTLIMTCLVVGAILSVTWLSNRRTQATFRLELEQQADLLLDALAATTTDSLYYLDADFLADAMQALGKEHSELVSGRIYDPEGRVIADAHATGFTIQSDPFGQRLLESDGTLFEWLPEQLRAGRVVIVGHQRLGAISVGLPTAPLESKIASVRNEGLLVALVAAVMGTVLALFLSRSITEPLQELIRATQRITEGDLTHHIPVTSGDELARLSLAMEQMRVELLSLYQGLEQEVAERTQAMQELAQANEEKESLLEMVSQSNRALQLEIVERKLAEEALAAERTLLAQRVKERTAELQLSKEVAEQAKLAAELANRAMSTFLAQMSHELRTPLNGILGYAQILGKDKNLSRKQKDGLDIINRSGEHLLTLINEILDLSKIEAGQMELSLRDFNLPQMLKNLADIFQLRAQQKGLSFIYQALSDLPPLVHGDPKRLQQVLINLLGNAIKFTATGSVTLKVGYHEAKLRFQVEDTGIGIAPEELDEIFAPFRQVGHQTTGGTGLGLAISKKLVEMMDGQLAVESKLAEGSTFWVELDLPKVSVGAIPGGSPSGPDSFVRSVVSGGKGYKVLIVDDKSDNRSLLVNMLAPLGFSILEASDGQEALLKAQEFQPNVILMDIRMPVMDGLTATRRLRELPLGRDVVIIVISASAFDYNRQQSLHAGANDFIAKPFRLERLLSLLQSHLGLSLRYDDETTETRETKKAPQAPIVAPPAAELLTLLDLAKRGNIRRLKKQADKVAELDEQYLPFANNILKLTQGFKIKQIEQFIKQHIQEHSRPSPP